MDRKEYISADAAKMSAMNIENSALAAPGKHLEEAAHLLPRLGETLPASEPKDGTGAAMEYLLGRTRAAEAVREKLFQARQSISRFRINEELSDFRLRHKIRLENLTTTSHDIEEIRFETKSRGGAGISNRWETNDFKLPGRSELETTVYPLKEHEDSISEVHVRVKSTDPAKTRIRMSLVTGIGDAELIVKSRMLAGSDENTMEQTFVWEIGDTVEMV